MKKKVGRVTFNGVILAAHEYDTVLVLVNEGYDIELLKPSLTKYVKTGDFLMIGLTWEVKSPVGNSPRTMEHVFRKAAHQAHNLIIDLRRTKIADEMAISALEKVFGSSRSVKNLWIITKSQEIVKMKK